MISGLKREDFVFRLISLPNPHHPKGLEQETMPAMNHDLHLVHVTRGELEFRLKDGRTAIGQPGCAVAIPPYQFYTCRQRVRRELEMTNIHFQISLGDGWQFQDTWEFPLVFSPKGLPRRLKSLRRHGRVWRKTDAPLPQRLGAAFAVHELVNAYVREHAGPLKKPQTDAAMLGARRMIENSILQPFHAQQIASGAGLSIAQFNRRFRDAFGLSPKEYWQRCLLRLAMARLLEPGTSIKETADALGFSDQFYFSRWFRRMQDISPSEFRLRKEAMP